MTNKTLTVPEMNAALAGAGSGYVAASTLKSAAALAQGEPARNTLGSLHGEMAGPKSPPSMDTIARRFLSEMLDLAWVSALEAARDALATEQEIQNEHSYSIQAKRVAEASEAYARNPNAENHDKIRHLKSLDQADHNLAQQFSANRVKEILAKVSPLCREILRGAFEVLEVTAENLWKGDCALYGAWNLPPVPSQLCRGIRSIAVELSNSLKTEHPFGGLPALIVELLKVHDEAMKATPPKSATPAKANKPATAAPVEQAK